MLVIVFIVTPSVVIPLCHSQGLCSFSLPLGLCTCTLCPFYQPILQVQIVVVFLLAHPAGTSAASRWVLCPQVLISPITLSFPYDLLLHHSTGLYSSFKSLLNSLFFCDVCKNLITHLSTQVCCIYLSRQHNK